MKMTAWVGCVSERDMEHTRYGLH